MIVLALLATLAIAQDDPEEHTPPKTVFWQVGYLDMGWFDAQGDGVAYERDVAHRLLGQGPDGRFADSPWVYYGDPWANMVNSQGDSADLGIDRTNVDRFDPIASGGRPTFLVNRFHHGFMLQRGKIGVRVRANLEPRSGQLGRLGDVLALDTAYLRWTPFDNHDVTIYAGRIESSFGWEYRYRHAPSRFGITPSIVSRYIVGQQTGVRLRHTLWRWFNYSVAVTNGSSTSERFGHFNNDLDVNGVPTATVRLGGVLKRPIRLEGGVSGQVGAQDGQPDPTHTMWQVGLDVRLDVDELSVAAEGIITRRPGGEGVADSLDARGGYVEVDYRLHPRFGAYARVDWRDAEFQSGPNLYVSNVMRYTAGARVELDDDVILKAEYLHLDEMPYRASRDLPAERGTEIRDDVFTTSLVFRYRSKRREF